MSAFPDSGRSLGERLGAAVTCDLKADISQVQNQTPSNTLVDMGKVW